jgi:hypothetical protein
MTTTITTAALQDNTILMVEECRWCSAQIGESHSSFCPLGERSAEVQRRCGVALQRVGIDLRSREECTALQVEGAQERGELCSIRYQGRQLEAWRFYGWVYSADPKPFRVQVLA